MTLPVSDNVPSLIGMMQELIGTPSVSSTAPGWDQSNRDVIEKLEAWLSTLGFRTEVMAVPGHPGKANLIATLGSGPGGLVFSGHTDTVPYDQGRWNSDPFKLQEADQRLYGLGTCDMKGFDALAIWALVEAQHSDLKRPLQLALSYDEEIGCISAPAMIEAMQEVLPKANAVIVGEPSMMKRFAVTSISY